MQRAIPWLLGLSLFTASASPMAAAQPTSTVSFVLDGSKQMGLGLKPDDKLHNVAMSQGDSRLDAARDELKKSLDRLASDGNRRVAVWFFGHRIAWEGDTDRPNLQEQTTYLEQTLGFEALNNLLPGDDIELARPLQRLEPRDVGNINLKLDALKPWGEAPLYATLGRVVDGAERRNADADRRVIVITCGENHQGMSKFTFNKNRLLDSIESRPVAIHIIRLGGEGERQVESELNQIAKASGGSYRRAESQTELAKLIDEALADNAAPPAPIAAVPLTARPAAAGEKMASAAPTTVTLKGTITYYKDPVRNAKVAVTTGGGKRTVTTDANGGYKIENVSPGPITINVEATVKNRIRKQTTQATIEASDKPVVIDVSLN